jgi:hypothetical protein
MKLIAVDSFYTDETKHVSAKQAFEVSSEETAKDLIKRGLAKEHDSVTEVKSAPAPSNKADKTPQNKAAPAQKNK